MANLVRDREYAIRPWIPLYDKHNGDKTLTNVLYGGAGCLVVLVILTLISVITLSPMALVFAGMGALDFGAVIRPAWRLTNVENKHRPLHCSHHMHISACGTLIETLDEMRTRYYRNKELAAATSEARVMLDEEAFERRIWEIAEHIHKVDSLFRLGREGRSRLGDVLERTLTLIRQDITTLGEAVNNVNDINVIETTNNIEDQYIDPTMSEILASSTRLRLQAARELMAGVQPLADIEPVIITEKKTGSFSLDAKGTCSTCKRTVRFYTEDESPKLTVYTWSVNSWCSRCGTAVETKKLARDYFDCRQQTIDVRVS